MRTPGERTSGAWTGGCAIHPDGGDETDRTAGNSYTATPHNTQGANSGQVLLQPYGEPVTDCRAQPSLGRYAWVFENPVLFGKPIPAAMGVTMVLRMIDAQNEPKQPAQPQINPMAALFGAMMQQAAQNQQAGRPKMLSNHEPRRTPEEAATQDKR